MPTTRYTQEAHDALGNGTASTNASMSDTRMRIDYDGGVFMTGLKSGTDQTNAGAATNELWVDTADQTIKLGT